MSTVCPLQICHIICGRLVMKQYARTSLLDSGFSVLRAGHDGDDGDTVKGRRGVRKPRASSPPQMQSIEAH
eukprot:533432-Amphidinium_carterae.1